MQANVVVYQGNLGQAPKERASRTQQRFCMLNVANNRSYKDRKGETKETTTWVGVACYGSLADYVLDVLQPMPGDELLVQGQLNSYSQEDRGAKRTIVQILASHVLVLRRGGEREERHYNDVSPSARRPPIDDEVPF